MKTVSLETVVVALSKLNEAYNARLAKASEANYGRFPTLGVDGRLHAPCDNYTWINGEVYLGGQYLPLDEDTKIGTTTYKFKVQTKIVPELSKIISGSIGKSWIQGDAEVAYYYASVSSAEKRVLEQLLPQASKQIVLADENTTSKTWEFSTKKFIKSYVYKYGFRWTEVFHDFIHMDAPGVDFNMVTKKGGKITFKSDFDGKLVCYAYNDSILIN